MLVLFPVQVFGITYHRDPYLSHGTYGSCKGKVLHPGEPDWNIVYYSAHMAFDLTACATATFCLIFSARIQGVFNLSKFLRRVLRNGLLYAVVVFLVNLWVVFEFAGIFNSGAASTMPIAVVMIAAQHLILSTQRLIADKPSSTDDYHRSGGNTARTSGPARFYSSQQDVELESGVFVVTESYVKPLAEDRKAEFQSADRQNSLDAEHTGNPDRKASLPGPGPS